MTSSSVPLASLPATCREVLAFLNLVGRMGYAVEQVVFAIRPDALEVRLHQQVKRDKRGPVQPPSMRMWQFTLPYRGCTAASWPKDWRVAEASIRVADEEAAVRLWHESLIRKSAARVEASMIDAGLWPPYLEFVRKIGNRSVIVKPEETAEGPAPVRKTVEG
jgi:hypothetical protein